jgi:hypothetical protein
MPSIFAWKKGGHIEEYVTSAKNPTSLAQFKNKTTGVALDLTADDLMVSPAFLALRTVLFTGIVPAAESVPAPWEVPPIEVV